MERTSTIATFDVNSRARGFWSKAMWVMIVWSQFSRAILAVMLIVFDCPSNLDCIRHKAVRIHNQKIVYTSSSLPIFLYYKAKCWLSCGVWNSKYPWWPLKTEGFPVGFSSKAPGLMWGTDATPFRVSDWVPEVPRLGWWTLIATCGGFLKCGIPEMDGLQFVNGKSY